MLFRQFQVFLAYVFLSGKLANPDPLSPLLVENSTIFLFKPSLSQCIFLNLKGHVSSKLNLHNKEAKIFLTTVIFIR